MLGTVYIKQFVHGGQSSLSVLKPCGLRGRAVMLTFVTLASQPNEWVARTA